YLIFPSSIFLHHYTATTDIYTLSLHDALPISPHQIEGFGKQTAGCIDSDIYADTREGFYFGGGVFSIWVYDRISAKTFGSLPARSEEHTSELQSRGHLVCRLLLEKKKE